MNVTLLILASLPTGFFIGAAAIGGVLLAPALILFGAAPHDAVALSLAGFAVTGVAGLIAYWPSRTRSGVLLLAGAIPGAVAGAVLLHHMSGRVLLFILSAFVLVAGGRALFAGRTRSQGDYEPATIPAVVIGALTGLGSALTGTGGPLILVPVLMGLGADLRRTILLGQALQLPIAVAATAANVRFSSIDIVAAALVGVSLLVGVIVGQRTARWLDPDRLRILVGVMLIVAGALLAVTAVAGR